MVGTPTDWGLQNCREREGGEGGREERYRERGGDKRERESGAC